MGGATISSMIKRFREGKPMSRKERMDQMESGGVSEMWFIDKDHAAKRQPPASAVVDDEPRKIAPIPNKPIYESTYSATKGKENTYAYNTYDPSIGIGSMRESRDSDFGLSNKKGGSDWRDNIDLRLSDSTGDIYGKGRSVRDPKKYSFDDDSFIKNALKRGVASSIDSDYGGKGNNRASRYDSERESVDLRYSQERPTYRFKDLDLKDSTDFEEKIEGMMYYSKEMDNFRSVGKNRESLKSPFNSLETLGSTGFKGLMMKGFGLDSKKGNNYNGDDDGADDIYGHTSTSSGGKDGNEKDLKMVQTDLEELLKTLHAESAALNKNYGNIADSRGNVAAKSISEITTDLQTEMTGFKSMFDQKYFEIESAEKEREKRDDIMREAGRLEQRSLLTMLDDFALRHPYETLVAGGGGGFVSLSARAPVGNNGPSGEQREDKTAKQKLVDATGIMRMATEIEYNAARESMKKIDFLRTDLGGRMGQIDYMHSTAKGLGKEHQPRSHGHEYALPAAMHKTKEAHEPNPDPTQEPCVDARETAHQIHENISKTSRGVLASLDDVIATLKHNIASAPAPTPLKVSQQTTSAATLTRNSTATGHPTANPATAQAGNGSHDPHLDPHSDIYPPPAMNPKVSSVHDIEYYTSTERYMDRLLERPRDDRFRVSRHPTASPRNAAMLPEPRSPMASGKAYDPPGRGESAGRVGIGATREGVVPGLSSTIYEKGQFLKKMQQERMNMVRSMAYY